MAAFDARSAKMLKPGEWLLVENCPGLRLEATKSRRTWIYRYRTPEGLRQIKVGQWPAMSVAGAVGEWDKHRTARDAGADPAAEKRAARQETVTVTPTTYTVAQVCKDFLAEYIEKERATRSANDVRDRFKNMLDSVRDIPAAELTREQAFKLIALHENRAPTMAKYLRNELGQAWDHALDAGRLHQNVPNWWREIKKGKLRSKGKVLLGKRMGKPARNLSDAQVADLLNFTREHMSSTVADVITLYLWTGTRGAEIVAMEMSELSRASDGVLWWTIPKAKTKNARRENATDLRVPLIGRADLIISERMATAIDGHLFPSPKGGHVQQKSINQLLHFHQPYSRKRPNSNRARLPASLFNVTPHDDRHTVRTYLSEIGCPHDVGEAILGHVKPGVGGTYDKNTFNKERLEWLPKVAAHWEEVLSAH